MLIKNIKLLSYSFSFNLLLLYSDMSKCSTGGTFLETAYPFEDIGPPEKLHVFDDQIGLSGKLKNTRGLQKIRMYSVTIKHVFKQKENRAFWKMTCAWQTDRVSWKKNICSTSR